MAPAAQTRVLFVIWLYQRFSQAMGAQTAHLCSHADEPTNQDNLFSTLLGLMDAQTTTCDPALDLSRSSH